MVDTFADEYQNLDGTTTMSEIDLIEANALAQATSVLADKMLAAMPSSLRDIKAARESCHYYAPDPFSDGHDYFYHIDLGCFASGLTRISDIAVSGAAEQVMRHLKAAVLKSYAGSDRVSFGSNGLCIYFPASRSEFDGDLYAEGGYAKTNTVHPVEFVQTLKWADFLQGYYSAIDHDRPVPSTLKSLRIMRKAD